jgi:hypothetical protein
VSERTFRRWRDRYDEEGGAAYWTAGFPHLKDALCKGVQRGRAIGEHKANRTRSYGVGARGAAHGEAPGGDFSPAFGGAVLGLAAFAWLEWLAAGGFIRHTSYYNINTWYF